MGLSCWEEESRFKSKSCIHVFKTKLWIPCRFSVQHNDVQVDLYRVLVWISRLVVLFLFVFTYRQTTTSRKSTSDLAFMRSWIDFPVMRATGAVRLALSGENKQNNFTASANFCGCAPLPGDRPALRTNGTEMRVFIVSACKRPIQPAAAPSVTSAYCTFIHLPSNFSLYCYNSEFSF